MAVPVKSNSTAAGKVSFVIAADRVSLSTPAAQDSVTNGVNGSVIGIEFVGSTQTIFFDVNGHEFRVQKQPEVFTVNIVSFAIAEAMHVCGSKYPRGVDELKQAGLTAMPGTKVASPWIAEAPASFECRRHVTLELGKSRQIIMGEIVYAHYREGAVDGRLHVDPDMIDAIARLGGDTCSTIRDRFEMLTPKL
ncbi:flavin reductase like protein [Rhizobium azibense]|uniref:Flavin reductase like protein n=1 Tax=Rhizobium azibense TaxID=1136135 RepID=A0A4V2VCB4_9HYPH|nr:flavin reductase like protein [Rhizobium azibense]